MLTDCLLNLVHGAENKRNDNTEIRKQICLEVPILVSITVACLSSILGWVTVLPELQNLTEVQNVVKGLNFI